MTLENYDAATGAGFGTTYENIFSTVEDDSIEFYKGKFKIDSAVVAFDTDSLLINLFDVGGELQKIGYVSSDESFNFSKEKTDLILFSEEYSTIKSGGGSDTIYGGIGNEIDAGDGRNQIYLAQDGDSTVVMSGKGRNTVHGFNTGYDGDYVKVGKRPHA